jgi:hypothetical protein
MAADSLFRLSTRYLVLLALIDSHMAADSLLRLSARYLVLLALIELSYGSRQLVQAFYKVFSLVSPY